MKFTDGNWQHRPGVTPHYGAEVYDAWVETGADGAPEVVLLVPCSAIRHRGDTLGGPVLTVRLSAPAPGVVAVRTDHFLGVRDPVARFDVEAHPDPAAVEVEVAGERIRFASGPLAAVIERRPFRIAFESGGRRLTGCPTQGAAWHEVAGDGAHAAHRLELGVGERVYGLGERFTAFVRNGQSVDIWNEDGGTNSDQAYKNVPFYLTDHGYGVFVNHPGRVSFELGTERTNLVQFSVPGETLEYWVVDGPTPKDVVARYASLTGRPALPPAWSFGLWLSTSFTTEYDEATVTGFVDGMAERGVPLSVFHYDCFWMRGMRWCDFEWDPAVFPDPEGMLARLHARGLRVCAWINPYVAQASPLFAEAAAAGYLLRRPDGSVWQWDKWQPGMGIVDFTNPDATRWFQDRLRRLLAQGVDALKTDFGERIPTDVAWHDGSDPHRMHNLYAQRYNQAVFEVLEAERGQGEAVLFARSATAGGQKYPVHWGGDCWSTFEAMAESLRGGLSLGMAGFGFWSHDIGGFEGRPPEEVYARWVQFGLLSSHSRLHGSTSYRVPWVYGDAATEVLRKFTRLKLSLMPYLWSAAWEAHETGVPVMRAMVLEFPDDPTCGFLDRQYLLGPSLLVAPVFDPDGDVEFYLPAGRWTDWWTGAVVEGPGWRRERHGLDTLPLYVRENALVATGPDDRPDHDARQAEVRWFAPGEAASAVLRGPRGEVVRVEGRRVGGEPVVEVRRP